MIGGCSEVHHSGLARSAKLPNITGTLARLGSRGTVRDLLAIPMKHYHAEMAR